MFTVVQSERKVSSSWCYQIEKVVFVNGMIHEYMSFAHFPQRSVGNVGCGIQCDDLIVFFFVFFLRNLFWGLFELSFPYTHLPLWKLIHVKFQFIVWLMYFILSCALTWVVDIFCEISFVYWTHSYPVSFLVLWVSRPPDFVEVTTVVLNRVCFWRQSKLCSQDAGSVSFNTSVFFILTDDKCI